MEPNTTSPLTNEYTSSRTVERAAQTAHDTIDRVAAKAGPAVEKVRSAATSAAETLQAKADALGEMQEQWVESARNYVRDNPLTCVAVGLAAGLLISKLVSSASSSR